MNNLPAVALLSARAPAHPLPLLIGLNLGPNLAVTGSLSAYSGSKLRADSMQTPHLTGASLLGLALVPLTIVAALGALDLTDPGAF